VEPHALVYAKPFANRGSFYPARTPQGVIVLGRDFHAVEDLNVIVKDPVFRFNRRDQGFELPPDSLRPFLGKQGGRLSTGYKFWAQGEDGSGNVPYDPAKAQSRAAEHGRLFLKARILELRSASALMEEPPIGVCAFDADSFGRFWFEGPEFIEAFFRERARGGAVQFVTPAEYLCKLDSSSFQTLVPEFSSSGTNGYAETWLDASNDWIYRHTMRALERMAELVERFPNNSGLKERALNQAAREILLVLASDWSKMLYRQESVDYAQSRLAGSLRNFTTIYEALGSNYISTEWLTQLEKRHNIFPNINYKVFRRNQKVTV
jgi:1,4-alpha-glucan branching enzyme